MVALENRERIISELITHVNELDAKVASLHEAMDEANDLQLVNKLDLINLKNDVERVALTLPALSPDALEDFGRIVKTLEKLPIEMVKTLASQVEDVRKGIARMEERLSTIDANQESPSLVPDDSRLKEMEKRISLLSAPVKQTDSSQLKKLEAAVERLQDLDVRKDIADIRDMLRKQQSSIEKMQEKQQQLMEKKEEKETKVSKERVTGKGLTAGDVESILKKREEDLKKETLQLVMKELQKVMS